MCVIIGIDQGTWDRVRMRVLTEVDGKRQGMSHNLLLCYSVFNAESNGFDPVTRLGLVTAWVDEPEHKNAASLSIFIDSICAQCKAGQWRAM